MVKLFLIFSKADMVSVPHVNANTVTIPQAGLATLPAPVMVDDIAGVIRKITRAVLILPVFLEEITRANKRILTLPFLRAVVLTVVVPRIPCGPPQSCI